MRSLLLSTIAMMGLVACGQQPRGTKIEYYVEEGSASDNKDESGEGGTQDDDAKVDPKALQLIFAEPTVGASEDQLVVTVSVQNPAKDATWTLFFSANQDLSQPTAIESDLPITQTQVNLDTSVMPAGSYYLYAEVVADGKNLVFKNTTPVVIEEDEIPGVNGKPTLSLQFPLGENVFVVGTPQSIRWEASDPDNDPVSYKLEYSSNGGTNWTVIADNVTEKTYAWTATGLTQGITYKVRVTASDDKGATAVAASPRNFGVALTPMTFAAGFGAMMTARCGNCHATGRPNQAQFRSNIYALATIGVAAKQMNIKTRIENNTMPPAGALGTTDKEILTMWLWDGAK